MTEKYPGMLIVIDGTDGSGKKTQTDLLANRLEAAGYEVEVADFPQYGQRSAALVEDYLNGKYGSATDVGPYRASIFYATDRYDASFKIRKWLREGKVVISNRYVTASMAHQGGKITDPAERQVFLAWLDDLEFKLFGIPRPDLCLILHVEAAIAQSLVDQKESRAYIHGEKRDIHEQDLGHLKAAESVYLEITRAFSDIKKLECVIAGTLLSRERISDLVWNEVSKLLTRVKLERLTPPAPDSLPIRIEPISLPRNEEPILLPIQPDLIDDPAIEMTADEPAIPASPPAAGPADPLRVERIHPEAKIPTRAYAHDAGLDLYSAGDYSIFPGQSVWVRTGIRMAIPEGRVGLIWDKTSLAKQGLRTIGGVVDAGYRGEIMVGIYNFGYNLINIAPGQKVAQILIQRIETPVLIEEPIADETERQDRLFGSSGSF